MVGIDGFFGQKGGNKLETAFVNQPFLAEAVGGANHVFGAGGRQAGLGAPVAVRHADKGFFANPRQPDAAGFGIGMAVGQPFQTAFFFLIVRYGVIARFSVQAFGMQHEVVAQTDIDACGCQLLQIAAVQTQSGFARYAVFRYFL